VPKIVRIEKGLTKLLQKKMVQLKNFASHGTYAVVIRCAKRSERLDTAILFITFREVITEQRQCQ